MTQQSHSQAYTPRKSKLKKTCIHYLLNHLTLRGKTTFLSAFKTFSLPLIFFQNFDYIGSFMDVFIFILLRVCSLLKYIGFCLFPGLRSFQPLAIRIHFSTNLFLHFSRDIDDRKCRSFGVVLQVPEAPSICLLSVFSLLFRWVNFLLCLQVN